MLRKQEEISRAKALTSIDDFVPKKVHKPDKTLTSADRNKSPAVRNRKEEPIELEDSAELNRSKKILQSKARYYDRMVASGGALNSDENCLVLFNQKKQTNKPIPDDIHHSSNDSSSDNEEIQKSRRSSSNLDEDW